MSMVEEAEERRRITHVLWPAKPEEGRVDDEGAPLLACDGAAEQGGYVGGGHTQEDLANGIVREQRGRHPFRLLQIYISRQVYVRTYVMHVYIVLVLVVLVSDLNN